MKKEPPQSPDWSFYEDNSFTPLINVSGTMTGLGASMAHPDVAKAMASILPRFVNMHELQRAASREIAKATGAEAGFVTASASAGLTLSVAAAITGMDPGRVEALPHHADPAPEVAVQAGHLCHYGAAIEQAVAMTGAMVVPVGQSTHVMDHQLRSAISDSTIAGVYVVSHHVVDYGQMPLDRFAEICHETGVPVIVDAASEYDLQGFLRAGADIVVYSAHKFLSGPTAGLVAGKYDLVRAAYLQNLGIGRGMKVGKESIFGAMAALQAWEIRDPAGVLEGERTALRQWKDAARGFEGVDAVIVPDPTGNPLERLKITMDPDRAGASAAALAEAFAVQNPSIIVRSHEVELGYIQLDPCNLAPGHAEIVAKRLPMLLRAARLGELPEPDLNEYRNGAVADWLSWLD